MNAQPLHIRWGVAGPGRAAARFAQGLGGVADSSLVAVWGRTPQRAKAFSERFKVPVLCDSYRQLITLDLDAVYIATHPDTHAGLCIQALAAGKHVLCEKPATLNQRQLHEVLDAARLNDGLFMEAMKPPFFPLYKRLREHLISDPIGQIGFIRAGHADATLAADHPLHSPALGGGGIMGIGPYEAFLAIEWLGPFKGAQVMGRVNSAGVDVLAVFQTEHEHGMAQLHTGLDLLSRGDAILSAPRGYILIHPNWWNPSRATVYYLDKRIVELREPFTAGGFNYETAHFCDLIREGLLESPIVTHTLSLDMAKLLESSRRQLGVHFPSE